MTTYTISNTFHLLQSIAPDLLLCPHVSLMNPFFFPIIPKPLSMQSIPNPLHASAYLTRTTSGPQQSGFRAGHSAETALLASPSSAVILLDLSAAFDTVNSAHPSLRIRLTGLLGKDLGLTLVVSLLGSLRVRFWVLSSSICTPSHWVIHLHYFLFTTAM